jgi:hypothetical protein
MDAEALLLHPHIADRVLWEGNALFIWFVTSVVSRMKRSLASRSQAKE